MDLELIEEIGRTAGFTSKRPPRNYASVYDEHDGADAGLRGEVLRRFIRGWREIGGDRRRINILAHEGVRIVALLHCGKNRSLRRINSEN